MAEFYDLKKLSKKPFEEQVAIKKKIINEHELGYIPPAFLPDVVTTEYYFVSYSHLDYREVYSDIFDLQLYGLPIWYDRGIAVGENWKDTAYKYMVPFACKGVIFYISKNAIMSDSIKEEIEFAKKYKKQILVICVSSNEEDKTWHLAEALYKEKKIKRDRYNFCIDAFPKDVVQLNIVTPADVRAPKINESLPKQNILEADVAISNILIPTIENTDKGVVRKEEMVTKYKITVNGLKDYYSRSITIDDYLSLLNDKAVKKEYLEKSHHDLDMSFEDMRSVNINDAAFSNLKSLDSIEIPISDTYSTNIGTNAFYNCTNLREVKFVGKRNEATQITLSENAFAGCQNLESFEFLNASIKKGCFENCSSLAEIDLSKIKNKKIEDNTFRGTLLLNITFSNRVREIGVRAFSETGIPALELPSQIKIIREFAFFYSTMLEKVVLSKELATLEDYAFAACPKLKEVHFTSEALPTLGKNIFDRCHNLEKIYFNSEFEPFSDSVDFNRKTKQYSFLGQNHNKDIELVFLDRTILVPSTKEANPYETLFGDID